MDPAERKAIMNSINSGSGNNSNNNIQPDVGQRLLKGLKLIIDTVNRVSNLIVKEVEDATRLKPVDKVIVELNTLSTFVKVKANTLNIDKVLFSFVSFDQHSKKLLANIDIYMNVEDTLVLAEDILSGRLAKLADREKSKGEKYPKAIWTSPLGGVNEQKARERKLRSDGKAVSRHFTVAPGAKQPFVLTAVQGAGQSEPNGIIKPVGNPETTIRVALTAASLKKLAVMVKTHVTAYYSAAYSNNMYAMPDRKEGR